MIYYLKLKCVDLEKSKRIDIKSIFFLNRLFNLIKLKY